MVTIAQPAPNHRRFRLRHAIGLVILVLLVVLIAARLYLPVWLKDYVNEQLNNIPGYRGSVEDIGVHLYRGAYTIHGLKLSKLNAGIPVPFIDIDTTDFSLQWGALFDGRIVSDAHLYGPEINFAVGKSGAEQTGEETDWNAPIKALMPIDINLVEVQRGKISYRDFDAKPPVNIYITNIHGTLNELRNTEDKSVALPSTIDMKGDSIGKGRLAVKGKLNVLTKYLDMDVDAQLENANLTAFNDFTNAYAGFEFDKGTIDLYSEIAVKDAVIDGYVKPIVRDLAITPPKDANPLELVWSGLAAVVIEIFTNQPKDQFATKVPLTGRLDNIGTEFWPTIVGVFRNAFVEAFSKGTDGEIQFNAVKGGPPAKETPKAATKEPEPKVDALVPNMGK